MVRGRLLANCEHRLTGAGQTQLLPRDPLDRGRIVSKGPDVGSETGVVGLQLLDLPRKRLRPLALADELQDPAIAEERAHEKADDHDDRGEDRGLFPETHFRPPALVSHADLNLYLIYSA
jgi:hypothetical protein